jgi:hypothetical protein
MREDEIIREGVKHDYGFYTLDEISNLEEYHEKQMQIYGSPLNEKPTA